MAWEVPIPAIWETFSAKIFLYVSRQPMVALRTPLGKFLATRLAYTEQNFKLTKLFLAYYLNA